MTIEEKRANLVGENGGEDCFPVGMRVLAVDDDPICLKVLENLLRKCQYHVTMTDQSTAALKMLRENRNKFDLVIRDVKMPVIDGFKLLELVGLELDLPVIMLSAYGDNVFIRKGISCGAFYYLVKPIRIEELKNIWQHVLRRKVDLKDQNKCSNQDKGKGAATSSDEGKENKTDTDEPSAQKKRRLAWSNELHTKFIACVKQLSREKAVPKKILNLMNVEGITRENVASHLQKYRIHLKKTGYDPNQEDNMAADLGVNNSSYMHIGSPCGFRDFRSLAGSSYSAGGMPGRWNFSAGLTSGLTQMGHSQNLTYSTYTLGKLESSFLPGNQSLQGVPLSLEINPLQCEKCSPQAREFPLTLQGNPRQAQSMGEFANQSSLRAVALHPESTQIGVNSTSHLPKFSSNPLPLSELFSHDPSPPNNLIGNMLQNMDYTPQQRWDEHAQNHNHNINSLLPSRGVGLPSQSMDQSTGVSNISIDGSLIQHTDVNIMSSEARVLEQRMPLDGGVIQTTYDCLEEDLMGVMIRQEAIVGILMDGDFGFDSHY